jgi:hypothetical protein
MTGRLIGIEEFRKLALRVGTVLAVEPLLGDLATVTVRLDEEVEALAPAACLPEGASGRRVVVATGLHPLRVGSRRFTACLITVDSATPVVAAEIPDGSPLA